MSQLLMTKQVDLSLLKAGTTIPKKLQDEFLEGIGVSLNKGQKYPIIIIIDGEKYEATITNVDLSDPTREVVQIRYGEKSPLCQKLNEIFSYSAIDFSERNAPQQDDEARTLPDDNSEYVEMFAVGQATLEFKCHTKSAKADFLKYLGGERDLAGYQRSYKLVFYKCFFELSKENGKVLASALTQKFQNYYIARKRAGLAADTQADNVIEDIENSSPESVYRLILRNPYNAISNRGFILKASNEGHEYFELNTHLQHELKEQDVNEILSIVAKKLALYYSKIDTEENAMNSLQSLFYRWINEYADILADVRSSNNYKHPFREIISKDIPNALKEKVSISDPYKVEGSYGKGRWTDVPWIALFDTRITTSAQHGVYVVYLLNKNTKELYLTLNQGATDAAQNEDIGQVNNSLVFTAIAGSQNEKMVERLRNNAEKIRAILGDSRQMYDNKINTGASAYDSGCVYYKKYSLSTLPDDDRLAADLQDYIDLLARYYNSFILQRNESETSGVEEELSIKDTVSNIKAYIAAKGFSYEDGLIENFYLSLKSKPFIILAGTSGTGKTRLVNLFAEAVGATSANGRYKMVAVRPDWSDSSDLFGHVDLNGKFIPGAIIDFVKQAEIDSSRPYFLCLDEMNLARVEYYLSDVLSVIETRNFVETRIETEPLVPEKYYGSDPSAAGRYGTIRLPENLYIIGTVNMDETTFPFSRKVLDRANTLEFSFVDLTPTFDASETPVAAMNLSNVFLKTEYLLLVQCADEAEAVGEYCSELQSINRILQPQNAHVGYRVRDEIVFYLLNNKKTNLLTHNDAMDNEIVQKILPRIQGSSTSYKNMLCELFKYCAGDYEGYQTENDDISTKMIKAAKEPECKYKKSAAKIAFMVRRYEEDGFTSYWL